MPHWKREWLFNIVIGIAVEVALIGLHHWSPVVVAQNWAMDSAMVAKAALAPSRDPRVPPLWFIDVDEETWRSSSWGGGEPFRAPRDKLLYLIQFAVKHHARYVVLDVLVEGHDEMEDEEFATEIAALVPTLKEEQQHLIFVRSLREPLDPIPELAPQWRESSLDKVIGHDPRNLHSASPYFMASRDGVVREWQLWRAGCKTAPGSGRGRWIVLPSVQIVIDALEQRPYQQAAMLLPWTSSGNEPSCVVDPASINPGDRPAVLAVRDIDTHLWSWLGSIKELTGHQQLEEVAPDVAIDHRSRVFYKIRNPPPGNKASVLPARLILAQVQHATSADFGQGVVVIGQTFEAARDSWVTPLGTMPGSLVLLNAVESIFSPGLLQPLRLLPDICLKAMLLALVGFLFAFFDSWFTTILIAIIVIPALVALNYAISSAGFWFDFAVPIIAIAVHRLWESTREHFELRTHRKRHGGSHAG